MNRPTLEYAGGEVLGVEKVLRVEKGFMRRKKFTFVGNLFLARVNFFRAAGNLYAHLRIQKRTRKSAGNLYPTLKTFFPAFPSVGRFITMGT